MRWTILVAAATLLFAGFAGVVSATNPCSAGTTPTGANTNVCVMNTESASGGYYNVYSYCDWWSCYEYGNSYSYSSASNTPASASASQGAPVGFAGVNAGATQGSYSQQYSYWNGPACCPYYLVTDSYSTKYTSINAGNNVNTPGPSVFGGAGFNQADNAYQHCETSWGCSSGSSRTTSIGANQNVYAGPASAGAGANFGQQSYNGGACYESASAGAGVNTPVFVGGPSGYVPSQSCVVGTPAGPVSTEIPQLATFCQATGAPDPALPQTVCTAFPAWDPLPTV